MSEIIIAAFHDPAQAELAVNDLEKAGYTPKDISVISRENRAHAKEELASGPAEGAVSGAATGGAIGGLAGLLAGAGILPALAGLLIGGPIAAALGATGVIATTISGAVTGAAAGGLIGALSGIGVPEESARFYDQTVNAGGILVAVPTHLGESVNAQDILSAHHAEQIHTLNLATTTHA